MQRLVFLDRATLGPRVTLRRPDFPHAWAEYEATVPAEIVERLQDATIAIINKVPLDAETLARLPSLRLIAVAATGTDVVDKQACAARGITVTNIQRYSQRSVPEHTFALMLAVRRSLIQYRESTINGRWQQSGQFCFFDYPIVDLGGTRLGIIGRGDLGQRVAAIARGVGMEPVFAARKGEPATDGATPWEEMLATSDVITLHCPLTPQTRGMIGLPEFEQMARRPLLVNTARGGIVQEDALETALERGLVSGAGIDVTLPEPPPADSVIMRIARRPNVVLTPHVAWASDEARQTVADQLTAAIEAYVAGRPFNVVAGPGVS
ncbi:MAG: D-2-hydroxyacid dehydrogenase [Acetobacteraceae bacterium]|nr:D-2-hydroxyacid dehydrogenase [Acetobacteraceae bacterium]